jgi:pyridoxamine 5'-phosphate oxidase
MPAMSKPQLATLPEILTAVWQTLSRASHDKHHTWRTPALATVGPLGADARTVVLREVDTQTQELRFFSDSRAEKIAQLQAQPQALLLMWSPQISWQLRLRAKITVQTEGLAVSSRWARLRLSPAAQDYLAPLAPGSLCQTPGGSPEPATQISEQRHYFALLTAQVLAIDWLELHASGHRRAMFDEQGARWLVP